MNPLLWMNAVCVPTFLVAAYFLRGEILLASAMVGGALGMPAWTLVEFSLFARRDPQRLQSEEYLLAQQRLMIQSKSSREPIDATTIPAGANPELFESPSGGGLGATSEIPIIASLPQEARDE